MQTNAYFVRRTGQTVLKFSGSKVSSGNPCFAPTSLHKHELLLLGFSAVQYTDVAQWSLTFDAWIIGQLAMLH
jgi:hypothetical protein